MPPLPSWDSLHPLIIHFPIALLLVAPVLVLISLVAGNHARGLAIGAVVLMLLGSAGAVVAVSTGEAAAELAETTEQSAPVLHEHSEHGEFVRNYFLVMTGVYVLMVAIPWFLQRRKGIVPRKMIVVVGTLVFLAAYGYGMLKVVDTGHLGGRLVHEYGIRAIMPPSGDAPSTDD